jgi:hypothetical protein
MNSRLVDSEADTSTPKVPDTSRWLTRNEAADLLMISTQTLANYERKGFLHPQHGYRTDACGADRRVVLYDPQELTKCPRYNRTLLSPRERAPGEITARACLLFREGKTDEEVVIELHETFERIAELREKWLDGGGAALVMSPGAKQDFEKVVGPFGSIAELFERVVAKLKTTTA